MFHLPRLTIQILAAMAEHESRLISKRTRAANAAARLRGVEFRRPENRLSPAAQALGTIASNRAAIEGSASVYRDLVPIVVELQAKGNSILNVARALNEMGHGTSRGTAWARSTVYTLMRRESIPAHPPSAWIGTSSGRSTLTNRTTARYVGLLEEIKGLRKRGGLTLHEIAGILNARGSRTYRGCLWNRGGLGS